jgi:hypothetical protein
VSLTCKIVFNNTVLKNNGQKQMEVYLTSLATSLSKSYSLRINIIVNVTIAKQKYAALSFHP